ncbi:MAG: transglutaminase [Deltaproteobacteria bacterium]|nr:transglutaminase [Deltaproteobacteria bacterium]
MSGGPSGPGGAEPAGDARPVTGRSAGRNRDRLRRWVVLGLVVLAVGIAAFKVTALGYRPLDALPRVLYRVSVEMRLDGLGREVSVRTFLPASTSTQTVSEEEDEAPGFHFSAQSAGGDRVGSWIGSGEPHGSTIRHSFSVLLRPVRYELDRAAGVPLSYPPSIVPYLRPEDAIQVDDPGIADELRRIGADRGPLADRLRAIFQAVHALRSRPFKGETDALTALRLGEASCNGKSRLFVALTRAAGIPARLVGGLILETGSKRTSHQWTEAWLGGHWVPFCPTNGHFASLPERYLTLYHGDEPLFRHTADINFDWRFAVSSSLVPSPAARSWMAPVNVWGLFERLGLPFSLLGALLLLPFGALVVVVLRNVVGLPTFGVFLPALLAAAASGTGAAWAVGGVLLLVLVTAGARALLERLRLLRAPMLAVLLAVVTTTMLLLSLVAERLGAWGLTRIVLFPIVVMAITVERFHLVGVERGLGTAFGELAGTIAAMLACYVVMSSLALQALLIGFPEVLLLVIAADIYLGRWVGVRLIEYVRFRRVLVPGGAP